MLDFGNFDNTQLLVLNAYVDNRELLKKICRCINSNYTVEQIEIIARAISLGIDVPGVLDSRLSPECMILLCDAIKNGVDVTGLDNVYVDANLLSQIIKIKIISNHDMSFVKSLSLSQCKDFIVKYKESIGNNCMFDFDSFLKPIERERNKAISEIIYSSKGFRNI